MPRTARGELGDFVPSHFEDQLQGLLYILLDERKAPVREGTGGRYPQRSVSAGKTEKVEQKPGDLGTHGRPTKHLLNDGRLAKRGPRTLPDLSGLSLTCQPDTHPEPESRVRTPPPPGVCTALGGLRPFAGPCLPVGAAAPSPPRTLLGSREGAKTPRSRRGLAAPIVAHSSPS